MLGGTDEDVARATPVVEDLTSRLTHGGPAGAGQLVKLVNQVLVGCGFAAIAEAAAMVRAADLPPDRVLAALSAAAPRPARRRLLVGCAARILTPPIALCWISGSISRSFLE
jgi:2-hydroxy-3-oxopropionate reductase